MLDGVTLVDLDLPDEMAAAYDGSQDHQGDDREVRGELGDIWTTHLVDDMVMRRRKEDHSLVGWDRSPLVSPGAR